MSEASVEGQNIMRFVEAVEKDGDLELVGTNADEVIADTVYKPDSLFILRDTSVNEEEEGAYPKQTVREVMDKCTTSERAERLLEMIKGNKNSVVLHGVTRIVGYYSRANNWNKSKIGELRDRGAGTYKLEGGKTDSQARMQAVNAL